MIRVLLADDQTMLRAGLRTILAAHDGIAVVGEAADGRQAVQEARRLRPDVVLMDVRMPGMDGIQATGQLAALGLAPPVRVLVLTTFDLDEYVYAALRAGASGFLLKDAPPEELVHAIGVVAAGDAMLAPAVTRRLIRAIVPAAWPGVVGRRAASRLRTGAASGGRATPPRVAGPDGTLGSSRRPALAGSEERTEQEAAMPVTTADLAAW